MNPKTRSFWLLFVVFLVLDQATKIWVYTNLEYRVDEIVVIPGFFSIVHAQNPGAAFSFLADFEYRHHLFLVFTAVACWVVWDQLKRLPSGDAVFGGALGLILSGAVGNAIDRIHKRTVTDFLDVYVDAPGPKAWLIETFGMNHWPSFNIADSALLVGVAIYFFQTSMGEEAADEPKGAADAGAQGT